jgi:predicted ester cyclase
MPRAYDNEAVVRRFYEELWNRWQLELAAFPDWHNRVEELVSAGDRAVARMTWSGTHLGALGEVEATGVEEAWVVGDTRGLWEQIRSA